MEKTRALNLRNFGGLKTRMETTACEGIVVHPTDGCMGKIKRRDFDYG